MKRHGHFSTLSVIAAWLFLAIPFLLVMFDWQSSRRREFDKIIKESDQNITNLLEKMQVSNNSEYQVLLQLNAFHRKLRNEIASNSSQISEFINAIYQQHLADNLPPHHLVVAYKNSSQNRLNNVFQRSTLTATSQLDTFALLMQSSPSLEDRETVAGDLTSMCGFSVNVNSIVERQERIKEKEEGIILPFTSVNGSTWLYWFYPSIIDDRLMVCAIFDTAKIPSDYAYKAMAKAVDSSDSGFAVIPYAGNSKPFWSPFLRQYPKLQRFIHDKAGELPLKQVQTWYDQFNIYAAPVLVGEPSLLFLVGRRLTSPPLSAGEAVFVIIVFVLFAGLSLMLLQRRVFRRGWRISIALVLLTAFITIFYLPASIGRIAVRNYLDSHFSARRQKAENDLERNLQRLEDRYDLAHADLFYRLQHLEIYPDIMQQFIDQKPENALKSIDSQVKAQYPVALGNSLLLMTLQQDDGKNTVWLRKSEDTRAASEMFATLLKSVLQKFRPELAVSAETDNNKLSLNEVKDEMISDFLIKFFQGVLGEEMFYRLLASPTDLVEADTSFLKILTTGVPIRLSGVVKGLLLIMWSEFFEAEHYLGFLEKNQAERAENFELIAVRKGSFQGYQRSTTPITPPAWDLIERTRRVGIQLTSREQMTSEDRLLIKTRPGKSLAMYILAGITSLRNIFSEQEELENLTGNLLVFVMLLLAALVAALYWYFMNPLKQLQKGLDNIKNGDYQSRIDLAGRNDEFGSIGRSFNAMAKGLEEGSLLGKFVSSAVIKVVKDKDAFEKAVRGEKREMTILFASLKTGDLNEAEAFIGQLAFHLKACQEAVRPTAGVIDKVMENKILVFFDHEACNGADHAVRQAIDMIFALKHKLTADNKRGYYGLTTGQVVAGILGARNLRLDYTVIGDAVNLAARLNALAADDSGSQIIADETTRSLLPAIAASENLGEIKIKGKTAPVSIHRLSMRA